MLLLLQIYKYSKIFKLDRVRVYHCQNDLVFFVYLGEKCLTCETK